MRLRNASLYGALNRTATPMGARMLRNWLSQPLAAVEPIRRRQEARADVCRRIPSAWTVSARSWPRCAIWSGPLAG